MHQRYIWSLPTRVFHWLLVVFIAVAFVSDEDKWLHIHAIVGYCILILLFFRLLWGIMGPQYSRFNDLIFSKEAVYSFIKTIFVKKENFIGHNPLASYVMMAMLLLCFLLIITGTFAFGFEQGKGIFSLFYSPWLKKLKVFKEFHELLSTLLIMCIVGHLAGVIYDKYSHKEHSALSSIVTGYKYTKENIKSVELTIYQKIVSGIFVLLLIAFVLYTLQVPHNIFVA